MRANVRHLPLHPSVHPVCLVIHPQELLEEARAHMSEGAHEAGTFGGSEGAHEIERERERYQMLATAALRKKKIARVSAKRGGAGVAPPAPVDRPWSNESTLRVRIPPPCPRHYGPTGGHDK